MKKLFAALMAPVLAFSLVGCGEEKTDTPTANNGDGTYEVAMITDCGNIDDRSFNQATWEGVKEFGEKSGKTFTYYRPDEDSNSSREEYMRNAVENGAKVVVCPGYLFEPSVWKLQKEYPDVSWLLIDGQPHPEDDVAAIEMTDNTHCIVVKEEQAGFFAGYAAVKEGYRNLGFSGGMAVPAVVRFGSGYLQGADYAAKELGVNDVNVRYFYSGVFWPTDDLYANMNAWYTDGIDVVFSCAGGAFQSVTKAAEANDAKVIGVDVDQAHESETIVTSAMKNSSVITRDALQAWADNNDAWPEEFKGALSNLGVEANAVCLPTAEGSWRFENFTVEEYEDLFNKIKAGEIELNGDTDDHPEVTNITVDYLS